MRKRVTLTHADYRAAYWLLGECCEQGALPEVWCAHLHQSLEKHLGVYMGVFFEGSRAMAHGEASPSPKERILIYGKPARTVLDLMRDYWSQVNVHDDPALPAWRRVRASVATRSRPQLASKEAWNASTIVNEYFQRTGCHEMMLSRCPATNGQWLMMNLWRAKGERPFGEREVNFVELLTREISVLLEDGRLSPLHSGGASISPRQKQVLTLLCRGFSEAETARVLGISANTVHNHIQHLHRALGVHSHGQLLALAFQRRLVDV